MSTKHCPPCHLTPLAHSLYPEVNQAGLLLPYHASVMFKRKARSIEDILGKNAEFLLTHRHKTDIRLELD